MNIQEELRELYTLEEISGREGFLQRRAAGTKLFVTLFFLITVLSIPPYDYGRTISLVFYPFIMIPLLEIPYGVLLRRTMIALPFVAFAGVSSLVFDRDVVLILGNFSVTDGMLSCFSLVLRTILTVSAVLIFAASTPMHRITELLLGMHIPESLVMLYEMTYRYIAVLAEEADTMLTAFRLRSSGREWPELREFGSFIGQLFLRSFRRAERVYQAMCLRLYPSRQAEKSRKPWTGADYGYLCFSTAGILLLRLFSLPAILGGFFT